MSGLAITILTTARFAVGTVGFLAPSSMPKLLGHPAPPSSVLSNRLWASRDGILAAMLFAAPSEESTRLALLGGLAADTLDLASIAIGVLDGSVGRNVAVFFGGGAIAFVGLGLAALGGLEDRKS